MVRISQSAPAVTLPADSGADLLNCSLQHRGHHLFGRGAEPDTDHFSVDGISSGDNAHARLQSRHARGPAPLP
jgi:hypothetical protein